MATLQTLDRGLKALFFIGQSDAGVSISELADELSVDRAIAYRLVSTLEANGLASRRQGGKIWLGSEVLSLEARYAAHFRNLVKPFLRKLAVEAGTTSFLTLADGDDYIAVEVSDPETSFLRVGYRKGSRHPLTRGAAGIAILAGRPAKRTDSDEVREARQSGFSVTHGALQKGAVGVACAYGGPRVADGTMEGSVGVVAMEDLDVERAKPLVANCSAEINRILTS